MAQQELQAALGLSPLVAKLLVDRGIGDVCSARKFIVRDLAEIRQPLTLPGVASAAGMIRAAVAAQSKITIYGDYDVDGVTGTAILLRTLRRLGAEVDYYIPHRVTEGYSLNEAAVRKIHAGGTKLLVTVDCGVGSPACVELACLLGMRVIIADHHPTDRPAEPDILVHCLLNPGSYGHTGLCGSATAWKIASALLGGDDPVFAMDNLILAALGTVADVVPLTDENRVIVHHGVNAIASTRIAGLRALMEVANVSEPLQASTLAFQLAPRINACGRLDSAGIAVELLTTDDPELAADLAARCDELNKLRKDIEKSISEEVMASISSDEPAVVLAGKDWHAGVLGIVASRVVEKTGKPAILCHYHVGGVAVGSGRSIPGLSLNKVLDSCSTHLESHGGHAQAVGLKVKAGKFGEFRAAFLRAVIQHWPLMPVPPAEPIPLDIASFTMDLLQQLDNLQPFGAANPEPVFCVRAKLLDTPRVIGQDKTHLSFTLGDAGRSIRSLGFGMAPRLPELVAGATYHWVARPVVNTWRNRSSVELHVQDFLVA